MAIVDDEEKLVRTYQLLFNRRHIPIAFVAYDGSDAIEKFKVANPKPGMVIIDYRLPSMSGMELMNKIKVTNPEVKIIFISGDDSIKQEALDSGANIFLKKPARIKEIMESVNSLLN